MLAAVVFKLGMLVSVQLIALTCALFLCIYVKKNDSGKWYSFFSYAITSVILLMMVAAFVGMICMACCKRGCNEGGEEKRGHGYHQMWRGQGGCERGDENCGRCRQNCDDDGEECEGDEGSCNEESDCEEGKSCKMPEGEKKIIIIKDTLIKKK